MHRSVGHGSPCSTPVGQGSLSSTPVRQGPALLHPRWAGLPLQHPCASGHLPHAVLYGAGPLSYALPYRAAPSLCCPLWGSRFQHSLSNPLWGRDPSSTSVVQDSLPVHSPIVPSSTPMVQNPIPVCCPIGLLLPSLLCAFPSYAPPKCCPLWGDSTPMKLPT